MNQSLVSRSGYQPSRWALAFTSGVVHRSAKAFLASELTDALCWLYAGDLDEAVLLSELRLLSSAVPVVVLTPTPSESQSFSLISAGARGYCHAEAAVQQLLDVASIVTTGGIWAPPELVSRLVTITKQLKVSSEDQVADGFQALTERELAVAVLVGKGFSNREIGEQLQLTERTVKAHMTNILGKLNLRDRVQLALTINRLPVH